MKDSHQALLVGAASAEAYLGSRRTEKRRLRLGVGREAGSRSGEEGSLGSRLHAKRCIRSVGERELVV